MSDLLDQVAANLLNKEFNSNPVSYFDFVRSRFKTAIPGNGSALLHAAVGVAGEVSELLTASDRANILEELGDIEFYVEAGKQQIPPLPGSENPFGMMPTPISSGNADLVTLAGALLDLSKKAWVYGKEIDVQEVGMLLETIEDLLANYYECLGTTQEEVRRLNVEKLMKRYPTGYSDAAAIARADKEGEEEPA